MLSTRAQILDAALRLFTRQGYQVTSIREIAEQLGLTKTAVLYHFPTKADIFGALAEPFLDDLQAVLDGDRDRWKIIEGVLDVYLKHRGLVRDNVLHDLALLARQPVVRRFAELMTQAKNAVAGTDPSLRARVRAAQIVTMLSEPLIDYPEVPDDRLREEILGGVHRLRPDLA